MPAHTIPKQGSFFVEKIPSVSKAKCTRRHSVAAFSPDIIPSVSETEAGLAKVGRNTVNSGGPVTVAVMEPIPCYSSSEGLFSVCLASGYQRRSCLRSRERASVTVSKKTTPSLATSSSTGRATCDSGQKKRGRLRSQKKSNVH